ncbi:MAG: hypothetical protein AB7F19_03325 [Candidatus Babeliales bacterium]
MHGTLRTLKHFACIPSLITAGSQPIIVNEAGNYDVQEEEITTIVIDADYVTINLKDSTIDAQGADSGIIREGHKYITIKNGTIKNARIAASIAKIVKR